MSPQARFDPVVHEPTRLQLCGLLVPVVEAEFAALQAELQLTAPTLSKHLKVLDQAGYVRLTKRARQGRLHTSIALTPAGREAFCGHVAEIQRLARVVRRVERGALPSRRHTAAPISSVTSS